MLLRIFTLSAALTTAKYCFADSPSTSNAYGLPEASSILGLDEDSSSSKHSDSAVQAHGVSITVKRRRESPYAATSFVGGGNADDFGFHRRQPSLRRHRGGAPTSSPSSYGLFNRDEMVLHQPKNVITSIPDLSDPCFRRYANSIIVNAQPYERRSSISLTNCKTQCLRSQTGAYSCRSFVYDNVNQVCDVFAHVGDQSPARLLRFQMRDYFEPTAAISCAAPPPAVSAVFADSKQTPLLSADIVTEPPSATAVKSSSAEEDFVQLGKSMAAPLLATVSTNGRDSIPSPSCPTPDQLPRYLKTLDFELYAHDDARVKRVSLTECMELCTNNMISKLERAGTTKCQSFEYNNVDEECVLSAETAVPLGNGQLKQKSGTDYYEKLCADERLARECGAQAYNRFPQMILVGFAETVVDAPTLQHCFDNCLNSRQLYGFRCISGMFYFEEPQLNCILNTEDRASQPDLFTGENSDLVDYFETGCSAFPSGGAKSRRFADSVPKNADDASSDRFRADDNKDSSVKDAESDYVRASSFVPAISFSQDASVWNTSVTKSDDSSAKLAKLPDRTISLSQQLDTLPSGWSEWTPCRIEEASPSATRSNLDTEVGVNGALVARGTQTRLRICDGERVCSREARPCTVTVPTTTTPPPMPTPGEDNGNKWTAAPRKRKPLSTMAAFSSVVDTTRPLLLDDGGGGSVKKADKKSIEAEMRRSNCPPDVCCPIFGGCRMGVRRVSADSDRLEWCAEPCALINTSRPPPPSVD